jgi:hypothetical protein
MVFIPINIKIHMRIYLSPVQESRNAETHENFIIRKGNTFRNINESAVLKEMESKFETEFVIIVERGKNVEI